MGNLDMLILLLVCPWYLPPATEATQILSKHAGGASCADKCSRWSSAKNNDSLEILWKDVEVLQGRNLKASGSSSKGSGGRITLAADRTKRPNPRDNFEKYTGGWDFNSTDYGASLAFTGAPGYGMSTVWLLLGVLKICYSFCKCCCDCRKKNAPKEPSPCLLHTFIVFVVAAVILTVAGFATMYVGQKDFKSSFSKSVDIAVNKADQALDIVNRAGELLKEAQKYPEVTAQLKDSVSVAQQTLDDKAEEVRKKVKDTKSRIGYWQAVIRAVVLIVGSLMLATFATMIISLVGRFEILLNIATFSGWFGVLFGFIMFGISLMVHSGTGDTCVAMKEFSDQPGADSALKDLIPCMDQGPVEDTLRDIRGLIHFGVIQGNELLAAQPNWRTPSNDPIAICNPTGEAPEYPRNDDCESAEVKLSDFRGARTCVTLYGKSICDPRIVQVGEWVSRLDDLYPNIDWLGHCVFVTDVTKEVVVKQCPTLNKSSLMETIGFLLLSVGEMVVQNLANSLTSLLEAKIGPDSKKKKKRYAKESDKQRGHRDDSP